MKSHARKSGRPRKERPDVVSTPDLIEWSRRLRADFDRLKAESISLRDGMSAAIDSLREELNETRVLNDTAVQLLARFLETLRTLEPAATEGLEALRRSSGRPWLGGGGHPRRASASSPAS